VQPYDTPSRIYEGFGPLLKYLSTELGIPVRIVIGPNYMSHMINIGEGRVDLAYLGPSPYVKVKDKYGGVELVARLIIHNRRNEQVVFITHKDSGLRGIGELPGKTFAFGDIQSYHSHCYPHYLLGKNNVKLKDLKSYDFLGNHAKVVLAVSHRDFDAGSVREDIFMKYRDRPVRVIAGPFATPPHVIVCRSELPGPFKKRLKKIFLKITDKSVLHSIDSGLDRFGTVNDRDFKQARDVVDFIEDR
jgi:phosphonate transport system substrate-binding protein